MRSLPSAPGWFQPFTERKCHILISTGHASKQRSLLCFSSPELGTPFLLELMWSTGLRIAGFFFFLVWRVFSSPAVYYSMVLLASLQKLPMDDRNMSVCERNGFLYSLSFALYGSQQETAGRPFSREWYGPPGLSWSPNQSEKEWSTKYIWGQERGTLRCRSPRMWERMCGLFPATKAIRSWNHFRDRSCLIWKLGSMWAQILGAKPISAFISGLFNCSWGFGHRSGAAGGSLEGRK